MVPCEEHVTVKFVNGNADDLYYESVTAHLYTENRKFTGRVDIFRPAKGDEGRVLADHEWRSGNSRI